MSSPGFYDDLYDTTLALRFEMVNRAWAVVVTGQPEALESFWLGFDSNPCTIDTSFEKDYTVLCRGFNWAPPVDRWIGLAD